MLTQIGRYTLCSQIGAGGTSTVYLAERDDDAGRRVAVKVVRGDVGEAGVQCAIAERQMLASLHHPNIARLVDGGETSDGRPYLVMEHVDGVRIDDYCDAHGLSVADRLELFCRVCDAVSHAHRRSIVHRDLKPSNILVTADGTPKLLDFGIARRVNGDAAIRPVRAVTPQYASPEQIRGDATTPSADVYSLGVLLHELLTGLRPDPDRVDSKMLREQGRHLRLIVITALQQDPARRYASVASLAADVRRHLDGLPIVARAATALAALAVDVRVIFSAMKTAAIVLAGIVCATAAITAQQDFSKVEIKTTKIGTNYYMLEGSGGAIGVLPGPDGVLMVDSQFAPLSEKIAAAIKQVSDGRITFLINTHVHPDHIGGNENFGKMGATIVAREHLRARMVKPAPQANGQPGTPYPAIGVPTVTYDAPVMFRMNGEEVHLIPVPVAHTDGDTMVYFEKNNVLMTGDFYRSLGYPNIDRANGGTMNGMLAGFDAIVKLARPDTKIVPGHGAVVDKTAVAWHKEMMMAVRDKVAAMVRQNKTQDEVIAAKLTSDFDAKVPGASAMTADRFVGQLYQELKK